MKRIMFSAFTLVLIVGIVGAGTLAFFTDTQASEPSTFASGTLELMDEGFATFEVGDIDIANMAPGDVTGDMVITIKNAGSLPLAWFGSWEFTGGNKLREALYIDFAQMEFLSPDGGTWETTDTFIVAGRGAGTYYKSFDDIADKSSFNVVTLNNWDGDDHMVPGESTYEHMGALNPEYAYKLTMRFGLHEEAGNEYQGDVTSGVHVAFKVDATQIHAGALEDLGLPSGSISSWVGNWMPAQLDKQQPATTP